MKLTSLLVLLCLQVKASHLLGGYIRVKPVAGQTLTYTLTAVIYAEPQTAATQALTSISLCPGDGTAQLVPRTNQTTITTDGLVAALTFETTYTYPGAGAYTATIALSNRSPLLNTPSADTGLLTLTTTFLISTTQANQTPIATIPTGGFRVGVNQRAVVSLRAADAENDSLVYSLVRPLTSVSTSPCVATSLSSFVFPNDVTKQGTFVLSGKTGELVWTSPIKQGRYSVAVLVREYRNGINISETVQEVPLIAVDLPGTPITTPPYEPAVTSGIITAVAEPQDASIQLSVFPNPVEENLQVVVQSNSPAAMMVQLLDATGRQLHRLGSRTAVRRHEQVIGMGSLSAGTYLIRADVGGRVLTEKVVKK